MSSLLYLKLDGIRSYCHVGQVNQDNRKAAQLQQTIQFKKPLTLIWGHNGSGKTTIIEALRTATTGVQPPNSEKGRSFLTDSHLLGQSKTDACIELGFTSINDREIVARRHFSIVYDTPNSSKFSSLRSTLQTKSLETGKLETLHSTCANFEKQIPCFLGVSVPILTNVLLCHQEEQLWMFSDNSTLKGIFDELFETTDLVNIETRLRDQLKEAESRAKILSEKVEYSKRDVEDGQRQKFNIQQSLEKLVSEIPVISDIKQQIATIPKETIDFNFIQSKMSDCADLVAQRNTVQENKMFLGLEKIDLNKLSQQEQANCDVQQLDTELKNLQQQSEGLQIALENKKNELQELQVDQSIDTLKQEVKIIRDQVKSQMQFPNNLSDENLIKLIKEKLLNLQQDEKNEQSKNQQLKNSFSNKLQILNEERQQCLINIKVNEQKRIEQRRLSNQITEETKQKEMQLQSFLQKKKLAEQQELRLQEKQKIQSQFEKTNQDLIDCYDISEKNQKITQFLDTQKKISDLQEQIKEAKQKVELIIRDNGWKATLKLNGTKKENITSLGKFEEQVKANLQLIKQQVANEQAQLKILNEQKQELKNKISFSKTIKQDETELEQIKQELREAKENKTKYVFNQTELIDQFTQSCKSTGKCLLCQKPTDQNILDLLKQRVKQNMPKTQAKINEFDSQINQLKAKKQKILSVIKNNEFLERILQLDQQIFVIQASLRNSTNEETIQQFEKNLEDLETLKQLIQNQLENDLNDYLQIKNSLQNQYPYLTGQSKLINNPHNQIQLMKTKNELGIQLKQYETISQNLENLSQIEDNISQLSSQLHQLRLKKQQSQTVEYDESEEQLQKIEKQKTLVEEECQSMNNQYMEQIMKLKQLINNLESILPSLEQKVCKKLELLNKSKNNQKYMDYVNALQIDIKKISQQLQNIEDDISRKTEKFQKAKELSDYIEKLSKWQKLDQQEEQLTKKIFSLQNQISQLQDEYQEQQYTKTKYNNLKTEYDLRKCKLEQSFQQIQEQKKDISKRYDGSEQIRLELLSELTATYQVIGDLKKYLSVLEMTMLECHGQKMKEINKYLFDTWQKIYNGKDIKFIEVKFDEIPNQKKLQKKYNYRLIMRTSNNTEIDMKGRCSMGQKMLASIVFRMALAECFGSNCCFLALDEPTSNLDRQHIKTLSEQLNSLIEFMDQQNQQIQLVIITHDLDLVKMLKKHSDSYYKISKKENGFSTIEERQMDELKL